MALSKQEQQVAAMEKATVTVAGAEGSQGGSALVVTEDLTEAVTM